MYMKKNLFEDIQGVALKPSTGIDMKLPVIPKVNINSIISDGDMQFFLLHFWVLCKILG